MRSKRGIFLIAAVTAFLIFGIAMNGFAGTAAPGSEEDPLVTKSYVDARIEALAAGKSQWQVVDLTPGQQLEGKAGAEVIIRVGDMVVVDPNNNGIPDLTAGTNITAGKKAALNHLFIIPRTDGRGFSAKTNAVVMYKGDMSVK